MGEHDRCCRIQIRQALGPTLAFIKDLNIGIAIVAALAILFLWLWHRKSRH